MAAARRAGCDWLCLLVDDRSNAFPYIHYVDQPDLTAEGAARHCLAAYYPDGQRRTGESGTGQASVWRLDPDSACVLDYQYVWDDKTGRPVPADGMEYQRLPPGWMQ